MSKRFILKGKLHSTLSKECLNSISKHNGTFYLSLHSKRLALENGADIKQIEAVLREADRSPSELLRLINIYTEEQL